MSTWPLWLVLFPLWSCLRIWTLWHGQTQGSHTSVLFPSGLSWSSCYLCLAYGSVAGLWYWRSLTTGQVSPPIPFRDSQLRVCPRVHQLWLCLWYHSCSSSGDLMSHIRVRFLSVPGLLFSGLDRASSTPFLAAFLALTLIWFDFAILNPPYLGHHLYLL